MSHPVGAGSGPTGAHPLNDDKKHRRGAWWWWLLALLLVVLLALLVVLLIRHLNSSDDKTTAAKKSVTAPATDPSTPASVPASTPASVPASVPASPATSGPAVAAALCAKPTLTVVPKTVHAGQSVTVSGRHFSGCRAAGSGAAPAATLPVQIGVGEAGIVSVIGNARTSATGAFDVTLVIPGSVTTGRNARLTMHAASRDAGTTLGYAGAATVAYAAASGGGTPTAVPAGSGGQATTTGSGSGDDGAELALLAAGLLLCGGGALGLARHRTAR